MDLLAFLVPKVWQNYYKLIREIPFNPQGNSCKFVFLARITEKSIKCSKNSYYSLISNKTFSHEIDSLDRPMTS